MGAKTKYHIYDVELYVIRALRHWRHYPVLQEYILFIDHEPLKHIHAQNNLSKRHVKWTNFMLEYHFLLKHKYGTLNQVDDAMSRKACILTTMRVRVLAFDSFKHLYAKHSYFPVSWLKPMQEQDLTIEYIMHSCFEESGFAFHNVRCERRSLRSFMVKYTLAGAKYWSRSIVIIINQSYQICGKVSCLPSVQGRFYQHWSLYPSSYSFSRMERCMDFILGLPRTKGVCITCLSWWTAFQGWRTLLSAGRQWMPLILSAYTLRILFAFMEC